MAGNRLINNQLLLVASLFLVATLVLATATPRSDAQIPPPMLCLASISGARIPTPPLYQHVLFPQPGGWRAQFDWSIDYDCPNGNFTDCRVAAKAAFSLWDAANQRWLPPVDTTCALENTARPCNGTYQTSFQTLWPNSGYVPSGTKYSATFYGASYDPTASGTCNGQAYQSFVTITLQIP